MHAKFFTIIIAAAFTISGATEGFCGTPSIISDRKMDGLNCRNNQLGNVLMTILRAAGKQPILDPALDGETLSGDFDGLTITEIIAKLEKDKHLQFESVGANTVYVSRAEVQPSTAPEVAFASGVEPQPPKPRTLDEVLSFTGAVETTAPQTTPPQVVPSSKKPIVLQAGLEHKVRLAPVDSTLRAGTRVDIGHLKSLTPGNQWARLPNWAAGTWKTLTLTAFYHYHYVHQTKNFHVDTFMDKASETLGWQKDAKGDLWQFIGTEFYTISEGEKDYSIDYHTFNDVITQSDDKFAVHHIATRALVDKITKKVTRVFQAESINIYTQGKNNTLRCKSSIKEFADDGSPVSLQKGISYAQQTRPFRSWDVHKKRDMRKLFAEYLETHGMSQLVPPPHN